jgi:hypothetical protein
MRGTCDRWIGEISEFLFRKPESVRRLAQKEHAFEIGPPTAQTKAMALASALRGQRCLSERCSVVVPVPTRSV